LPDFGEVLNIPKNPTGYNWLKKSNFTAGFMKKLLIIIMSSVLLYGCPPCDPIIIDLGPLPASALAFVPYLEGQTYRLKHSGGLVISYTASRETRQEMPDYGRSCDHVYKYEVNSTKLTPDYPVYTFMFEISNPDTSRISCNLYFVHNHFTIAGGYEDLNPDTYADSMLIGDQYFYQVYKIRNSGFFYDREPIYADSLYYNYEYGILQIKMSNGESFTIYE
jgi:hypothetical protein